MKFFIVLDVVLLALAICNVHVGLAVLALCSLILAVIGSSETDHEATGFHA